MIIAIHKPRQEKTDVWWKLENTKWGKEKIMVELAEMHSNIFRKYNTLIDSISSDGV